MDDSSSLNEKLKQIENRLKIIESQLNIQPPSSKTVPQQIIPDEPTLDKDGERSGNWLGIIAVLCFVLAAGFIIKLSIESGWLTPTRQIGIAALFGLSLIGFGLKFLNLDREYSSLLPGCGIIILYLSVFAAHNLYKLITFQTSMILFGVISLLCIYLYIKIRHDIYPITATVGAYLAPVVLGLELNTLFTLYYLVVCSVTFSLISIYVNSRLLTMISAYLAISLTAFIGLSAHEERVIVIFLALHFIILSLGIYGYTHYTKQPLTEKESWSLFPVLLIFYGSEYYYLYQINPQMASWLSLAFAAFVISLYALAKTLIESQFSSQHMLIAFACIVIFHAGYLELLPATAGPWLFVLIMLGLAFLPTTYTDKSTTLNYAPVFLLVFVIAALEYTKMIFDLFSWDPVSWPAITASIIGIWVLYIYKSKLIGKDESFGYAFLGAIHLMVVLSLYQLADPHGSLAVSASWLIYAIGIIFFGFIRKDKIMANSALYVLFFSAAKALLYDASSAPTIIRIFCLLITGAVLYGAGFIYRKIAKW